MMNEQEVIDKVIGYVKEAMLQNDTGHGWSHIERVVRLALHIHECEGKGDRFTVELGALMHDIGDHKFAALDGPGEIRRLLSNLGVDTSVIEEVVSINESISFSKGKNNLVKSHELQIVQDADRLDAIGAIGIARAFNYGGYKGREIYDPRADRSVFPGLASASSNSPSTVHHFYDKLLILREMMNTSTGRKLADERHDFMVRYLDQFFREWNPGNE